MRRATKTAAAWLGIAAGAAGIEHGIFEILQGRVRPEGLVISSIGPPCVPEEVWNACEPALTIVPDFLITGILAVFFGLLVLLWSAFFLSRKASGAVLMGLSIILLLFGGGFFPPLIGLVAGTAGLSIHRPLPEKEPGAISRFLSSLWPWPMVVFLAWVTGQWVLGYYFNDWFQGVMIYGVGIILLSLFLSVICAGARDRVQKLGKEKSI